VIRSYVHAVAEQGAGGAGRAVAGDRLPRGLHRNKGGVGAGGVRAGTGLSGRFGFEWAERPASKGRVIAGLPEQVIAWFSSRRAQITKLTKKLAEEYERDRGHEPDQRAVSSMRQFANARTRRTKAESALEFSALLREWAPPVRRNWARCATSRGHLAHAPARTRAPRAQRRAARATCALAHARTDRPSATRSSPHATGAHTRTDPRDSAQLAYELAHRAARARVRERARVTRRAHARARTRGDGIGARARTGGTRRVDPLRPGALHRPAPA
jgi:hypothetical protein